MKLRLIPRQKIQRVVEVRTIDDLPKAFEQRIADGYMFGDFQFSVDERSDDFLRKGVFSCYRPVDSGTPMPAVQRELVDEDWHALLLLAHNNKAMAFDQYSKYYLSTSGQIYWSDTHQLSTYLDDYHVRLDKQLGVKDRATEMITEIYVPRPDLPSFMAEVAKVFRTNGVPIVYGTVRLIEQDDESFLAWAKRAVCLHHLQSAHGAYPGGHRSRGPGVPRPDRHGHEARRTVLPDVSPARTARSGRGVLSAAPGVSAAEAEVRSAGALSE